ncbi:hypothetical protein BKA64DRAFT_770244 [Cadophora sp. MPI-SDFR-AT-0126]|nr:hypothetical protein BKA64DRAFT_770244 [Leotiomycetes sp. MPI-SDFR-AT-0126]
MAPPPISLIEDLSRNEIEKLTQLLILPPMTAPDQVWLQQQSHFIPTLPLKLKRPESLLPRIAMSFPFGKQKAHLCPSHKPLNPHLIRRIFLQVSAECTTRLGRLVSNPYLPTDIAVHVKALQKANSLWMSPDIYRWTFQCQPHEERYDRIASDCEACILAAVGGNICILQQLRASMLGRKKNRGVFPRLLPLVESWIKWMGAETVVREESDQLAREIRNCRKQMREARRQKRRNEEEGILDPPPEMSPTTCSNAQNPFVDPTYDHIGTPLPNHQSAAHGPKNPFADPVYDHGPFQNKVYGHEDRDEHEQDNEPEGSIIDFYARRLSSANLTNRNNNTRTQNEAKIHPAFKDSMVFQFQTNATTYTLPQNNPFNDQDDQESDSLPPRPGNPTAYYDPEALPNGGGGPTHRGASARVHQPPPLAYHNRTTVKQMQNSWKRATGYSESVYSRDVDEGMPPPSSFAQQNGGNQTTVGGRIEEEEGEYVPPRRGWKKADGEEGRGDGDGDERGRRRDTKVTIFGDFI